MTADPQSVTQARTRARIVRRPFPPANRFDRRAGELRALDRYSRMVLWLKILMPAAALALLLLVAAWPRLESAIERLHFNPPRLDLSQARDLRMVNARFSGIDRHDRPFTVTADSARQHSGADDSVELAMPKADLTTQNGTWLALQGATGLYQPQPQILDLFGDVELFQDRGNEFHTDTAHIDMAQGTAEGHDPVEGHGPFGTVTAEGFRTEHHGDLVIFTGKSHLVIEPRASKDTP